MYSLIFGSFTKHIAKSLCVVRSKGMFDGDSNQVYICTRQVSQAIGTIRGTGVY